MPDLSNPTPWVRVVIVNYDGGPLLAHAVEALARQTMADFEAVIVDNASTDGSATGLRLPDDRFRVVHAATNLGFAAGCNLGVQDARTPWLAMLNPDAVPAPDWLEALRAATLRHAVTMFGSTQLQAENDSRLDGAGDNYSIFGLAWRGGHGMPAATVAADTAVFSPCAAAALYRRDAFEAAGGFAETFFCYLEDVDLGFRLRLAGHRAVQVAAARVRHVGSALTGRTSPFTVFHSSRNGIYLLIRCMPAALLPLALPLYLSAQAWLMISMAGIAPAWPRLRGIGAGLRALPRLLAQRRAIQRSRRIGARAVARLLTWHPWRVMSRDTVPLSWEHGAHAASG